MKIGLSKKTALGGVLAALGIVIMLLGGTIPVATYVCPMLCMILCYIVYHICGRRFAWAWYGAVSLLSCIFSPDKEAAAVFVFLGFYPIIKLFFDNLQLGFLLKLLYINLSTGVLYFLMIYLLGTDQLMVEFTEFGLTGLVIIVILGNVVFILADVVLTLISKRFKWR